jgi:hypothetical protein
MLLQSVKVCGKKELFIDVKCFVEPQFGFHRDVSEELADIAIVTNLLKD